MGNIKGSNDASSSSGVTDDVRSYVTEVLGEHPAPLLLALTAAFALVPPGERHIIMYCADTDRVGQRDLRRAALLATTYSIQKDRDDEDYN